MSDVPVFGQDALDPEFIDVDEADEEDARDQPAAAALWAPSVMLGQ